MMGYLILLVVCIYFVYRILIGYNKLLGTPYRNGVSYLKTVYAHVPYKRIRKVDDIIITAFMTNMVIMLSRIIKHEYNITCAAHVCKNCVALKFEFVRDAKPIVAIIEHKTQSEAMVAVNAGKYIKIKDFKYWEIKGTNMIIDDNFIIFIKDKNVCEWDAYSAEETFRYYLSVKGTQKRGLI